MKDIVYVGEVSRDKWWAVIIAIVWLSGTILSVCSSLKRLVNYLNSYFKNIVLIFILVCPII